MNDYQPKVGDRVMVSEHGPYRVVFTESGAWADLRSIPENNVVADGVPLSWLTPAPEPEPDEPTAPGALVRDGEGDLVSLGDDLTDERAWVVLTSDLCGEAVRWRDLPRPITVILGEPAEVETLRSQRDALFAQRDELRQRIDRALDVLSAPWEGDSAADRLDHADDVLRGGS